MMRMMRAATKLKSAATVTVVTVPILFLTPALDATSITAFFAVLAAVLGGATTTYYAVAKIRKNVRAAKAAEEASTLARITDAVAAAKKDQQHIIDNANQLSQHWKEMAAVLEAEKLHEREQSCHNLERLENDIARLRAERQVIADQLVQANTKIETILDLNLGYQGQIADNSRLIKELQEKVELIDGTKSAP